MTILRRRINIVDNSGATVIKTIQSLKAYNNSNNTNTITGNIIKGTIFKINKTNAKIKWINKKAMCLCVIVKYKECLKRINNFYIKSRITAGILIKDLEDYEPIGNRIRIPIYYEVRKKGFIKIAMISKRIL